MLIRTTSAQNASMEMDGDRCAACLSSTRPGKRCELSNAPSVTAILSTLAPEWNGHVFKYSCLTCKRKVEKLAKLRNEVSQLESELKRNLSQTSTSLHLPVVLQSPQHTSLQSPSSSRLSPISRRRVAPSSPLSRRRHRPSSPRPSPISRRRGAPSSPLSRPSHRRIDPESRQAIQSLQSPMLAVKTMSFHKYIFNSSSFSHLACGEEENETRESKVPSTCSSHLRTQYWKTKLHLNCIAVLEEQEDTKGNTSVPRSRYAEGDDCYV